MGDSLGMYKQSSVVYKNGRQVCYLLPVPRYVEKGAVNLIYRQIQIGYKDDFLKEGCKTSEISENILGSWRKSMHPQAMMLEMTQMFCLVEENNLGMCLMSLLVLSFSSVVGRVLF